MNGRRSIMQWLGIGLTFATLLLFVGTAQAADVTAQQTGHISNGSGNVESDLQPLDFQGTFKSRFRVDSITPGTREVVAIAVALCDGGTLGSDQATILVPVAGAAPRISGGLGAIPCVVSPGADALATGFNGGVVTFSGPLAQYMGTVRIYADTRPRDGTFFQPSELITQGVPNFNAATNQATVSFGRQGQILTDGAGRPVAVRSNRNPLVLIVTVDVDNNAPSGQVDVALGVGVGDDTAQGAVGICATNLGVNCGSNLMVGGPARDSFQVSAQGGGSPTPPPGGGGSIAQELQSYDQNGNDRLEDGEFLNTIDDWVDRQLSDNAFFAAMEIWINQSRISSAALESQPRVQTRMTSRGVRFVATGATSLSVDVYGLDGRSVFHGSSRGSELRWSLRTQDGAPLANGVYLYRTTLTTSEGQTVHGEVRKLIVTR